MSQDDSGAGFSERRPLNGRQVSAITRLLAGDRVSLVAEAVGVSERQLWRWLKQPDFRAALAEAQGAAMTTAAAALVLEYARQYHELDGLERRISELERRVLRDGQG